MEVYYAWLQDHTLSVTAVVVTIFFAYYSLVERDTGARLSKRYRNSIFEAQSKIFLNATQYLISGNKDLAIKEFLNAVDLNRETLETYFALGGLFRSNGEIEKAISIHRSLIARENISESARLRALKELAIDFDKGGFIDKAIETYNDVLLINRDQQEVLQALCRIYENIEDWDQAYNYRLMLSKTSQDNQSETIAHILIEKARNLFDRGEYQRCSEELEEAFRHAPSVSAKILSLRLALATGNIDKAKMMFVELLNEHPMYTSFVFLSLDEKIKGTPEEVSDYLTRVDILKKYFLELDDAELLSSPSVALSRVRVLKSENRLLDAYQLLQSEVENSKQHVSEILKIEYIKILKEMGKNDVALKYSLEMLENLNHSLTRHYCQQCGFNSDNIFWRCPQCHEWETIQFRWKV